MLYPRQIVPGGFWMLTRRTTQQLFLLRPDQDVNDAFLYVLADAVTRYGIRLLGTCVESNHHHTVFQDPLGKAVEFYEHLHKMVAKTVNALRGRRGAFWSEEPPSLVELVEPEDVLDKLVYCLTNPVKDFLVERVEDWPGVNTLAALLEDERIVCKRVGYFRAKGPMRAEIVLELVIPPALGDPEAFRRTLRERVAAVEAAAKASKRRVLGRRAILAQDWWACPDTVEPRRGLRPLVAAKNAVARVAAIVRRRDFIGAYRRARAAWLDGESPVFPLGTYWLPRFAGVPVERAPC